MHNIPIFDFTNKTIMNSRIILPYTKTIQNIADINTNKDSYCIIPSQYARNYYTLYCTTIIEHNSCLLCDTLNGCRHKTTTLKYIKYPTKLILHIKKIDAILVVYITDKDVEKTPFSIGVTYEKEEIADYLLHHTYIEEKRIIEELYV